MKKIIDVSIVVIVAIFVAFFAITSCNVTRTITTTASQYQKGDTTVVITTKTVETYDGSVKPSNFIK